MLISSDQKVRGQDRGWDLTPAWTISLRRTDGSYPARVLKVNLVTLSTPPYGDSEPRGEPASSIISVRLVSEIRQTETVSQPLIIALDERGLGSVGWPIAVNTGRG